MVNENDPAGDTRGLGAPAPSGSATAFEPSVPGAAPGKELTPEAIRALHEAEARRQAAPRQELPTELYGRDGQEPTRYGDWEKKGLAVDF
jgi:hypothetical protein